jgi:hypothetical protein
MGNGEWRRETERAHRKPHWRRRHQLWHENGERTDVDGGKWRMEKEEIWKKRRRRELTGKLNSHDGDTDSDRRTTRGWTPTEEA